MMYYFQPGLLEHERNAIRDSSNGVNMNALMDWIKKNAQYKLRLFDLEQITAKRNEARKLFEDLRRQRLEMFMSGFGCITLKLKVHKQCFLSIILRPI